MVRRRSGWAHAYVASKLQIAQKRGTVAVWLTGERAAPASRPASPEPYIYEFDLTPDVDYYVRVFAYNDNSSTRLGPYAITRPPTIRVTR